MTDGSEQGRDLGSVFGDAETETPLAGVAFSHKTARLVGEDQTERTVERLFVHVWGFCVPLTRPL